jgi:malonate transporter and related proteins
MLDILSISGPIFIAIGLGFLATRFGIFARTDLRVLGKFVVNFALPALLFKSLSERQVREIFNISYLLAYLAGSLAVLGLGYLWSRRIANLGPTTSTFYAMGMSCSNSGFVGYPILLLTLAPVAAVALALNMMVENLVILPLLLVMAERENGAAGQWYRIVGQSLARLAKNPMIVALVAGFCVSCTGWRLPEAVVRSVGMFALTSGALSLFVIGGTLFGLPFRGTGRKVMPIVIGKLLVHPVAVLLACQTIPLLGMPTIDPSLRTAAVIMAAVPMLSIYTILAQIYGQDQVTAPAMLVTTVTSFFTLSGLLFLLRSLIL